MFRFLATLLFLSFFYISCSEYDHEHTEDSKAPNIVLILTDDQGWGDFSMNGNDSIYTPVLDQLAKESVSFDRFYVSPLCAPTRSSLLTGRYHLRTGTSWVTHRKEVMRSEEVTIAESLKAAGYSTGIFGKWHNGEQYPNNPQGQGFDEFLGFTAGHLNNYFDPNLFHNGKPVKKEGYINDIFTDAAIEFIEKNKDRPFFCYIPYNTPHSPFQVPDKYFDKYKKMGLNDKNASVHGMCENIDENTGRLLNTLVQLKLMENTIFVYLTDNGPNGQRFNGGMRGTKGSLHEGGMRVPLLIRWKGYLEEGKVLKHLASHIDILPTLLDLSGVEHNPEEMIDGRSLVPLMTDMDIRWNPRNIYHIQTNGKLSMYPGALRNDQHRFVLGTDSSLMLFDMLKDPGQNQDIADEFPELVEQYFQEFKNWFSEVTVNGIEAPAIPVGYPESPETHLPAPEATLTGNMKFQGKMGWANDYISNWTAITDYATWDINVISEGDYQFAVMYSCLETDIGSTVKISVGTKQIEGNVKNSHDPGFLPSPDRIPRGEVYEKVWQRLDLRESMHLTPGKTQVKIESNHIPGKQVIDLKAVQILRK